MKIVLRLLDDDDALLGWTEIQAQARGDGCLWSPGPVVVVTDTSGVPAVVSLHWCEVNTEVRLPLPESRLVAAGQPLQLYDRATPIIVCGKVPGRLPAVTLRKPVAITVPVQQMGVRGQV